jgi:hypothetical protein
MCCNWMQLLQRLAHIGSSNFPLCRAAFRVRSTVYLLKFRVNWKEESYVGVIKLNVPSGSKAVGSCMTEIIYL